jgi:hypothetical protein
MATTHLYHMASAQGLRTVHSGLDRLALNLSATEDLLCPTLKMIRHHVYNPPPQTLYHHPRPPHRTRILPALPGTTPIRQLPVTELPLPSPPTPDTETSSPQLPQILLQLSNAPPGPQTTPQCPAQHGHNSTHHLRNQSAIYLPLCYQNRDR